MYDIIIVGLGPAGSTLARLIGKKYNVLALEKRNLQSPEYEAAFKKCCGGLLAPDAQEMLAKFALGLPQNIMVGPQLFAVKVIDIPNKIEAYYQRHYINIDREKFDRWLVSLIPQSVNINSNCFFKGYENQGNKIKVTFSLEGKEYSEYTKVLVGADGANSKLRGLCCTQDPWPEKYISVQEWFKVKEVSPFYSAIFDEQVTDFYSWAIPKEHLLIVGSAIPLKNNLKEKFALLKQRLSGYSFKLDHCIFRNGAYILRPLKTEHINPGKGNIILIGEAAGLISPSSAEGLSYAFSSATSLAECLKYSLEDVSKDYDNNLKALKKNILMKNLKCPTMYNPSLRKMIIDSGLKSIKIYT